MEIYCNTVSKIIYLYKCNFIKLSYIITSKQRNESFSEQHYLLHLRMRSSKSDLRQVHRPKDKEKKTKGEGKLQPIRNILQKVGKTSRVLPSKYFNYVIFHACDNKPFLRRLHWRTTWTQRKRRIRRSSWLKSKMVKTTKKKQMSRGRRKKRRVMVTKESRKTLFSERKPSVLLSPLNGANWHAKRRWKKRLPMHQNHRTVTKSHLEVVIPF